MNSFEAFLNTLPQQRQCQGSLADQIQALVEIASKLGLTLAVERMRVLAQVPADRPIAEIVDLKLLDHVEQLPANPAPIQQQLQDATVIAVRFGLYDAADLLRFA